MDNLSSEKRSVVMASIKGKNTRPEIILRKQLWQEGFRYRIHDKTIFGTPDISNKKKKLVIFIDGCFWHGCPRCYKQPKTNGDFWKEKILNNKKRRKDVRNHLRKENWKIVELWEHEVYKEPEVIQKQISQILNMHK